jgi:spermidine dehydrogenase
MSDNPDDRTPEISRRNFVGGLVMAAALPAAARDRSAGANPSAAAQTAAPQVAAPQTAGETGEAADAANYPPLRTGLRGQYPGSFEVAHQLRDGAYSGAIEAADTGEHYDLVVVGAGISGLSAAYFYRKALGRACKILLLDNHDDFGGHAKRNEFLYQGRTYLSFGGSMSIETPFPYSHTAKSLLAELGVMPTSYQRYERPERLNGLSTGVFFDREHFLGDRVVSGWGSRPWRDFFADAPVSAAVRADLIRLHESSADYLPGLDPEQKAQALKKMSYQRFLLDKAGALPTSLPFFGGAGWTFRNNMQMDTCPAYIAWRGGAPGFRGMSILSEPKFAADEFHFPDGNASLARLLVSRVVPAAIPGDPDQDSIVSARVWYSRLDLADSPVRIRLKSIVVRVEHLSPPDRATERAARVCYVQDGGVRQVTAANVVLACFNNVIPFLVPDLPQDQKTALHYASKVPMQISNVLLQSWAPFEKLGVSSIHAPNGYHQEIMLDVPLAIGGYESVREPNQPVMVQLVRNPHVPGLPRREQNRLGRADMLSTPFEVTESQVRRQLDRVLGPAGFDSRRDIIALTVNRWPHGYAYAYDTLGDPDLPEAARPHVIGRRAFGRITIANADAGAGAFVNVAIDQAQRAVQECLASRGLI